MAVIEDALTSTPLKIESSLKALRSVIVPRGDGYVYSGTTGTIAAALAVGSNLFVMRSGTGVTKKVYIDRIRIQYTCLVTFTTALTAGRRLTIHRGSSITASSGGTGVASGAVSKKDTSISANSVCDPSNGGDVRLATTGALTLTSAVLESEPVATISLAHVGTAGNYLEQVFEFSATECSELVLNADQYLTIRNPVAMDAAGTWQLSVKVDWREAEAL